MLSPLKKNTLLASLFPADYKNSNNISFFIRLILWELLFEPVIIEINRERAIKKALQIAAKGDLVVIAGKGHEDYQIFEDKVIHFDDYEVVKRFIQNHNPGNSSTHSQVSGAQFNGRKNGWIVYQWYSQNHQW